MTNRDNETGIKGYRDLLETLSDMIMELVSYQASIMKRFTKSSIVDV